MNLNYSSSGLLRLKGKVNDSPATIILDSGSSISIMNSSFVKTVVHSLDKHITVVGITNNSMKVQGWTKAAIQFYDSLSSQTYYFNLYVVDNFKFDILLGNDFHSYFKIQINYLRQQININHHNYRFENIHTNILNPTTNSLIQTHSDTTNPSWNTIQFKPTSYQLFSAKAIIIPPMTVKRISISSPNTMNSLNLLTMTNELASKHLLMPDMLLRKEYTEFLSVPIINPSKNAIKIPANFPISNISLFDELPITTTNSLDVQTPLDKSQNNDHIANILNRIDPLASHDEREHISKILTEYSDVFAQPGEIGKINCYKHTIRLIDGAVPIKRAPYRKPAHLEKFEREKIAELLEKGIIQPSHSPWGMGVVIVEEGHKCGKTKTPRLVIDSRPLNKVMIKDAFPLPNVQTILDWIGNRSKYLTIMDVEKGFWGLPLEEESIPLTAFISQAGLFEWLRMPFGVANGSAAYSRAIAIILSGLLWNNVLSFIDDIILADSTIHEHGKNLRLTFTRFRQYGVKISIQKSTFLGKNIPILGHIISPNGIQADPTKISVILDIPTPKNAKELLHFLASVGYFRRFIRNYAKIAKPLYSLTSKTMKFAWTPEHEKVFVQLKAILTNPPVLAFFDFNKPIHIYTDASGYGVGAALLQPNSKGLEQPICFASKTLNKAQVRYSTTEREFLAIYFALKIFHPYIYGRPIKIFTDHKPIVGMKFATHTTKISSRLATWALLLQEHNYEIIYNKGSQHQIVDGLSRLPMADTLDEIHIPVLNVSIDFLSQIQITDLDCQNIREQLLIPPFSKNFAIKADLLVNMQTGFPRPVIPKIMRNEILHEMHSIPYSGHLGFARCYEKLKSRYFWPTMKTDLYNFIQACDSCLTHKRHYGKKHGFLQPLAIPTQPFDFISTDIVGPFPESESGNKYIINAICHFSKWAEFRAVPDQTASTVVKFLEEQIFCQHGCPKYLLSDNGPAYISKILACHSQIYNIKHKFITPYNSKSNGLSERLHQTLTRMISNYVNLQHNNWDKLIHQLQFAYNTTIQTSTQTSPFKIIYGREPLFPTDLTLPESNTKSAQIDLTELHASVRAILEQEQATYKLREDKWRKPISFEIGEKVKLKSHRKTLLGQSTKFLPYFTGLYAVTSKLNDLTYEVQDLTTNRKIKTHVDRMRKITAFLIEEDDDSLIRYTNFDDFKSTLINPSKLLKTIQEIATPTNSSTFKLSYFPTTIHLRTISLSALNLPALIKKHSIAKIILPQATQLDISFLEQPIHSLQRNHVPSFPQIPVFLYESNVSKDFLNYFSTFPHSKPILIVGPHSFEFLFSYIIFKAYQLKMYPSLFTLLYERSQYFPIYTAEVIKITSDILNWFPEPSITIEDSDSDDDFTQPENPSRRRRTNSGGERPLRRSTRIRKPPDRLQYDHNSHRRSTSV
jgi:hypothetical protein